MKMVEGGCVNDKIGFKPLGEKLFGHIILVDTVAGRFGPAGKTAGTVANGFLPQVNGFNLGTGCLHAVYQM
jgi:hypothetical protein